MKKLLLVLAIILFSVFVYIWEQVYAPIVGVKVNELNDELDKVSTENENLMFKINSILALEKLDKIAKDKNLYKPDETAIVEVD
ncbi:hypothetical protein [Endomicrobium proavitum]|uniref:Cell division protein FtsL n=1 Tax=Endomicrobium proavitum TaxID=1408281 RepID=A0A0G3WH62_9BACT|nr:hypothetical protein [Endomicrobium proavitum]AKL97673.1 cell division protein FtsL [Endomicrobium proavitum]